jgi:signal transduction histidine kinase
VAREGFDRQYLSVKFPVQDGQGNVFGVGGVSVDITERKSMESALRDVIAEQRQADHRKDEFLATLAHELRNPLAPIRYALEIIKSAPGPRETSRAAEMMDRQLQQLTRLVDDLLDVNRIGRGTIEMKKAPVNIGHILDSAIETTLPMIREKMHELTVERPDGDVRVDADLVRMSQVIANLLGNAAKYTKPCGKIRLAAALHGDEVVVSVEDNGIGIEPDLLPCVFDMFARDQRKLRADSGGLGIGLTIAGRLVAMHGGSIAAESDGSGQGSRFFVRLPVCVAQAREPRVADDSVARLPRACGKVLVVDDNVDSAVSLSLLLENLGYETLTAHSGAAALALADEQRPDAILLDIGLPELDGYEVCRMLRERPWARHTMIAAVTGWGQERHRQLSQEAGFDHHIVKPVEPAFLCKLLAARIVRAPAMP